MNCPLCKSSDTNYYTKDRSRDYCHCDSCDLIFVPKEQLISLSKERARYDTHNNNLSDSRYCEYLWSKAEDLLSLGVDLSTGSILDFGAGKEAVLTALLKQKGYRATPYDPLYGMNNFTDAPYHLIIMNEVIEHLYTPFEVLSTVIQQLEPSGYLYVHTELSNTTDNFVKWWYRSDETHVVFFSEKTIQKLCDLFSLRIVASNNKNRVLFQKTTMAI